MTHIQSAVKGDALLDTPVYRRQRTVCPTGKTACYCTDETCGCSSSEAAFKPAAEEGGKRWRCKAARIIKNEFSSPFRKKKMLQEKRELIDRAREG